MFLQLLKTKSQKELFMKLACHLSFVNDKFEERRSLINWQTKYEDSWSSEALFQELAAAVSKEKLAILRQFDEQLGKTSCLNGSGDDGFSFVIRDSLNQVVRETIDKARDDVEFQRLVSERLGKDGVNLAELEAKSSVTVGAIFISRLVGSRAQHLSNLQLLFLPEIQKSIFEKIFDLSTPRVDGAGFANEKVPYIGRGAKPGEIEGAIKSLDLHQKKAVIFELICLASANGPLGEMECFFVRTICEALGLDPEFTDEAGGAVNKISVATAAAVELITE